MTNASDNPVDILRDYLTRWLNYIKQEWPSHPLAKYEVDVQSFEKTKKCLDEEVPDGPGAVT